MTFEAFIKYPVAFLTGLIVALMVTRFWGPRAVRWGFLDRPGDRKIHLNPIPVAGGISIFLAFHAVCAMVFLYPWQPFDGQLALGWWWRFIPLSLGVLIIGLIDDRINLQPITKLLAQTAVAVAAFFLGISVQNVLGASLPMWLDLVATLFWFLLLMNAFNLIDGADGLATGIALIASIGIGVSLVFRSEPGDVLLLLGFAGACLGFLRYNFYPARVFLGDTGSLFIGFTLGALAISTSSKAPTMVAIGVPLLAVGVPLFDTLLAVWRRSIRQISGATTESAGMLGVHKADQDHLHHRLLRAGRRQRDVALILYGATVALATLGVLISIFHDRVTGILALAFFLGAYTIVRHLAWIELRDSGEAVLRGLARPVRRNRTLIYYVACDLLILNVVLLAVLYGLDMRQPGAATDLKRWWLQMAPFDVGLPFLFLILFRSYSRIWYLARVSEYMMTGLAVAIGFLFAWALPLVGLGTVRSEPWLMRYLLLMGTAAPLIVGIRASLRIIQDALHWLTRHLDRDRTDIRRALIAGTGFQTTLFLRQLSCMSTNGPKVDVVGIINQDAATRGHYVHGYRVVGQYEEVSAILKTHAIDALYLVEQMGPTEEKMLRQAAQMYGVQVMRWTMRLEELAPIECPAACDDAIVEGHDPKVVGEVSTASRASRNLEEEPTA